jgi:hypothetical protein
MPRKVNSSIVVLLNRLRKSEQKAEMIAEEMRESAAATTEGEGALKRDHRTMLREGDE